MKTTLENDVELKLSGLADRAEKAAKKQRILELIATKEDESLAGKSLEELQKLAGEL